jgi:hypothetical protein
MAGTTLNVSDDNNGTPRTATLYTWLQDTNRGSIAGLAPATITYEHSDTAAVNLSTGKGSGNVVNVWQTGAPLNVNGHNRMTINVGNGDYGVQDVWFPMTVNNTRPRGTNLIVYDGASPYYSAGWLRSLDATYGLVDLMPAWIKYAKYAVAGLSVAVSDVGADKHR